MPEIVFIMGKSASGKDNIYQRLSEDKELKLKKIIMYTTRPMRAGETDGVEYFFVDDDRARRLEQSGKIIEMRCYNTVYGVWKYFTADDGQIDLNSGERYIVIGTLEAYDKFCRYYGKEHLLPIYIEVDDGVRLIRAVRREMQQAAPGYEELCSFIKYFYIFIIHSVNDRRRRIFNPFPVHLPENCNYISNRLSRRHFIFNKYNSVYALYYRVNIVFY